MTDVCGVTPPTPPRAKLHRAIARRVGHLVATLVELRAPAPERKSADDSTYGVLFVCKGNICRSPMAEGILRGKLAKMGYLDSVRVDSAGTSEANAGRRPDGRARLTMCRHGNNIGGARARGFAEADFKRFDLIIAMDDPSRRHLLGLARSSHDRGKVRLLLDFAGGGDVPDPVNGNRLAFEQTYALLEPACHAVRDFIIFRLDAVAGARS